MSECDHIKRESDGQYYAGSLWRKCSIWCGSSESGSVCFPAADHGAGRWTGYFMQPVLGKEKCKGYEADHGSSHA